MARIQDESGSEGTPNQTPFGSRQTSQLIEEPDEGLIETAICTVVTESNFSVSVADPTSLDSELIAVSEGFVRMTGYPREDVLGENCRFLNEGCEMPEAQRERLVATVETGVPFVGVLVNKKKSGEVFLNLLDLRGLVVARNVREGEDIWVLVGVQLDVTGVEKAKVPENHLPVLNQIASRIRQRLMKQLGELGLAGFLDAENWHRPPGTPSGRKPGRAQPSSWCLAPSTVWKA
eukprot:CAMPEP_0197935270 /NCGR_PEP_ID=MMETSP1439-20131203/113040_1 /TAXON_ID=66791 /ORGANISM="Gonyaulax spinifera, Strain CCMP409" /LENGTH=233 /DNA_ID=CAMNT_0043558201 /DNA_START=6 /DNA_END=703 /DNA_ORIENTATION=-